LDLEKLEVTVKTEKMERDIILTGILICRQLQFESYLKGEKRKPTLSVRLTKRRMSSKNTLELQNLKRMVSNINLEVSNGWRKI